MRIQALQSSFADGQISPRMQGMVELESYKSSLATLENMIVLPQGSLTRRPGTFFAARTKNNGAARLIPFSRGQGTSLILEFGNLYIRFFANDGPVRTDDIAGTYSQSTTTVTVTKSTHGYSVSDEVYLNFTSGNGIDGFYTIATVPDANTFTVTSTTSQSTSGNVNISQRFEITTSYTAAQVDELSFTQSADVLFLAHPSHPPARLERFDTNLWTLTNLLPSVVSGTYTTPTVVFTDGPFLATNTTTTTMTVALADTANWTASFTNGALSLEEVGTVSPSNVDVTTNTFTLANHPLVNGMKVQFTGGSGITKAPVTGTYSQSSTTVTVTETGHSRSTSDEVYLDFTSGAGVDGFHTITGTAGDDFTVTSGTSQTITGPEDVTVSTRLATGTDYFVVSATQNTFKIATTAGGTPIDLARAPDTEDLTFSKSFVDKDVYVRVTASSISGINDGEGFKSTDRGRYLRLNSEIAPQIKWGYGEIIELLGGTSTTVVLVKLKKAIAGVGATTEWQLGSFSETTGYPRTVQIYQQRLVYAGTSEEPQTLFFSRTGDFFNFAATEPLGRSTGQFDSAGRSIIGEQIYEDNALSLTISSDTVDQIEWLNEDRRLTIGTSGGVFQCYGTDDDLTLTPFNFTISKVSAWACDSTALPAKVGNNLLYVQTNGRKLRELAFDKLQDQYSAADLTLRSEDISETGIIATAYQDQPYSVLWCLRNDGRLAGLTYVDLLQMRAWHRHTIGGSHTDATYGSQAKVESIAVIPRGTHDQLWMIVKRDIDGGVKRYIEFMERYFVASEVVPSDAHFVDSGLEEPPSRTSASTSVLGLDHLEGESVAILADAAVQPNRTVSSGAITLQTAATNFRIGFGYNSDIETLPMVAATSQGTSVGNRKRIHRFTVRLLESLSFKFGTNANDLDAATIAYLESLGLNFGVNISDLTEAVFRTASDNIGSALAFFTGEKTYQVGDQFNTITQLFLRQDQPYPFSVTLLAIDYQTNE